MTRFQRPPFDIDALRGLDAEQQTRLQFDWWTDDVDREAYLDALKGRLAWIQSRSPIQDDPSPLRTQPVPQGHAKVALITDPGDVDNALASSEFSNIPYAELGGAGFMLALDPLPPGQGGIDWHQLQRSVAANAFRELPVGQLGAAAACALRQAEILSLQAPVFDLAEFGEQAALRYFSLLFGFAGGDHALLEDAARRGYRALQYLIVGRHFASEPGTLPAAQQALGRLSRRSGALMDDYARLLRSPRRVLQPGIARTNATWPDGVQPWDELGLSALGHPILRRLPALANGLNGQDLCSLVGGLLVGTVGNVQTSLCLMLQQLFAMPMELQRLRDVSPANLLPEVRKLMAAAPPVPFLPRRTGANEVAVRGGPIPPRTDCILALRPSRYSGCPWGVTHGDKPAPHSCLGQGLVEPLLVGLLHRVLQLPGLEQSLDGLTGEVLEPERLWGMGCLHYPLRYRRDRVRAQQPLIVVMKIKAPVAENAARLRQVIRSGAPRIQWALDDSRHVHMAWFEFMDNDSALALRTVYDGDFDAYIQHFALKTGELFDQLFDCIEGAPPLPVAEHPNEFVETIRRANRSPAGGYFYSAYPRTEAARIPK